MGLSMGFYYRLRVNSILYSGRISHPKSDSLPGIVNCQQYNELVYRTEIENCEYDIHQLIFYFHMLASLYSERYYMNSLVRNINIIYYSLSTSTSTSTSTYRTLTIHTHTHTTSQTNNQSNQTMALTQYNPHSPLHSSHTKYPNPHYNLQAPTNQYPKKKNPPPFVPCDIAPCPLLLEKEN